MISTSVNGQNCWLLPNDPNAGSAAKLGVSFPVDERRSLSGRPTRRPQGVTPRLSFSWVSLLSVADFQALRDSTLASQDEPILVPLWPHAYAPATETATMQSGLTVAYMSDWSQWAINPASLVGYDYAAPLMYGRFKQPPRLAAQSGNLVAAQFDFEEDSPAQYAVTPVSGILAADQTQPSASGDSFPIFPFLPDWEQVPKPGVGNYDVDRQKIGPGRMKATVYYTQVPERIFSADFTQIGKTEAAQLVAWWIRRLGTAAAHFVPIANFGIQGGMTVLARHTNETLTISYLGPLAQANIAWRETANENSVPSGETLGTTLGQLATNAWFFEIDLDYNGATQSWYLTNYESGATANGQTWQYNACDFDALKSSIDLQDDSGTATFRYFSGGPWDNWLPGELAARGWLTISRADVAADGTISNFRQLWKGEMTTPQLDGPIVKQRVQGANAIFGRNGPRQIMSTACGTALYSTRCGLALGDWTFTATIVSVAGNVVTIGTIARQNGGTLPGNFGAQDWFALGWMGWLQNGMPYRNGVLTSAAIDGNGQIQLTLDRSCSLSVGASVTAVPGCDRVYTSGCVKFINQANFRGYPNMPAISPNFVIPVRNATTAKK